MYFWMLVLHFWNHWLLLQMYYSSWWNQLFLENRNYYMLHYLQSRLVWKYCHQSMCCLLLSLCTLYWLYCVPIMSNHQRNGLLSQWNIMPLFMSNRLVWTTFITSMLKLCHRVQCLLLRRYKFLYSVWTRSIKWYWLFLGLSNNTMLNFLSKQSVQKCEQSHLSALRL